MDREDFQPENGLQRAILDILKDCWKECIMEAHLDVEECVKLFEELIAAEVEEQISYIR